MKPFEETKRRTKKLSFFLFIGILDKSSFNKTPLSSEWELKNDQQLLVELHDFCMKFSQLQYWFSNTTRKLKIIDFQPFRGAGSLLGRDRVRRQDKPLGVVQRVPQAHVHAAGRRTRRGNAARHVQVTTKRK